jgi:Fe-Mn family superoxide dismutase
MAVFHQHIIDPLSVFSDKYWTMRDLITLLEAASGADKIEIVDVAYSPGSLAPVMSQNTFNYHYGKLAHGYAERFNKREGDPEFNYAGAWLHNVFFTQFRAPRNINEPNGPIGNLIKTKFKSWNNFKDRFATEAMRLQGSGWVYLARDGSIKTIHNHQVRNDILILVDMWEHAFNMDYAANKKKYLDMIWRIFDWNQINTRWGQGYQR